MAIEITVSEVSGLPVMYWKFSADWTWKDMDRMRPIAREHFEAVGARIPLIFDMLESESLPDGAVRKFPEIMQTAHKNAGDVILVSNSRSYVASMVLQVAKLVESIYHARWNFHFVDSLVEAEDMVQAIEEQRIA